MLTLGFNLGPPPDPAVQDVLAGAALLYCGARNKPITF